MDIEHELTLVDTEFKSVTDKNSLMRLQERLGHQVKRCSHVRGDLLRLRGEEEVKMSGKTENVKS